jgi:hypothetical protein
VTTMPRDGSLTPRDLIGRLAVLRVESAKCNRARCYRVKALAGVEDWLDMTAGTTSLTIHCTISGPFSNCLLEPNTWTT